MPAECITWNRDWKDQENGFTLHCPQHMSFKQAGPSGIHHRVTDWWGNQNSCLNSEFHCELCKMSLIQHGFQLTTDSAVRHEGRQLISRISFQILTFQPVKVKLKVILFTASQINTKLNSLDKDIIVEHWNNVNVVSIVLNRNLLNECHVPWFYMCVIL